MTFVNQDDKKCSDKCVNQYMRNGVMLHMSNTLFAVSVNFCRKTKKSIFFPVKCKNWQSGFTAENYITRLAAPSDGSSISFI